MKKLRISTKQLGLAALAGCLVAGSGGTAKATQLWYDGIATPPYDTSVVLNGQSGGTGTFFTGPWADQSGNDHHVAATSLPHGDLIPGTMPINPKVGGSIVGTDTPGSCCDTARDARIFTTGWGSDPDGTFYISFFANYGVGPTLHHRVMEMWNGDQGDDGNRQLQLGYSEFTGVGTGGQMGIQVHDVGSGSTVNQNLVGGPTFATDGKTHLIVMRFDLSSDDAIFGGVGDRIRVYLDPIGTLEPGSAAADVGGIDFAADRMGAVTDFVFGDSAKAAAMDEIRVGTTFADVANLTVPEPASFVLLGLGAIGFGLVARRKVA